MNEKNLKDFFSKAELIEGISAYDAGQIGYMARVLIQATLPHSDPKQAYFERKNGGLILGISANPSIGIPYGVYPRLLLSWIVTEAVKTKEPELILGASLNQFMQKLGLLSTGGRWGTIARLKDQMHRLFASSISFDYTKKDSFSTGGVVSVARKYMLWWDAQSPNQTSLLNSTVILNTDFFNEIVERPIPIDMRAIAALKTSCVALDLYCWLTYRMSYLNKETLISWEGLQDQFGSNYGNNKQGRYKFKEKLLLQLKKVLTIYDAKVSINEDGLIIKPSVTHIKKKLKST
jgi:hypothetical protein